MTQINNTTVYEPLPLGWGQYPIERYHGDLSTYSGSTLKEASDKSLNRFNYDRFVAPRVEERKDHFDLGTGFHTLTLEPKKFFDTVAVYGPDDLSKSGRRQGKIWDAFVEANEGKALISQATFQTIANMKKSILSTSTGKRYLKGFIPEHTGVYNHPCGLRVKMRPDAIPEKGIIIDLKSWDSKRGPFNSYMIYKMKYDWSGHLTVLGAEILNGYKHRFILMAVDVNPPHDCVFIELSDKFLNSGKKQTDEIILKLAKAEESGEWNDSIDRVTVEDPPNFVIDKYSL